VSSLRGEVLGKTPLTLDKDKSDKVSESGLLNFKVSAPGHLPRLVFADANVTRELRVVLPKTDSEAAKAEFSRDFGQDLNKMLRRAFVIQKLVTQKKFPEALQEIAAFKQEFPQLAYGHVIGAHIALAQGNKEEAKASLLRAQALAPDDPDVAQSLKMLSGAREP